MRNRPWKSLMKSKKKKKKLSTSKIANKTTAYMKVFLIMRAHGVSWFFMPFKSIQLITNDSIPHLHRNELSQMQSNIVFILKEYVK